MTKRRGNATLEFVLGWSLLWGLFGATYQYGQAMYSYNVMKTAVADAAVLGAEMDYDISDPDSFTTALQNMVVYGDTTAGTSPMIQGFTTANVTVSVNLVNNIPTKVEVSVKNFSLNTIFSTFNFIDKPRTVFTYIGRVTCSRC
jgi:Flp pilus assembly protein TadG